MNDIDIRRRLDRIETYLPRIQLRPPVYPSGPQRVKIIGGQTVNSITCVQYAADPFTADQVYNPLTATTYMVGLGYGVLYSSLGQNLGNVVVRHNYQAFTDPLIAGTVWIVGSPTTLSVAGSTATAPLSLNAYPIVYG